MGLESTVDAVTSREDFLVFLAALRGDLSSHPGEWENSTLDAYLEALAAWIQDMDGYYKNRSTPVPMSPSWKNLAEMMLAAKSYEQDGQNRQPNRHGILDRGGEYGVIPLRYHGNSAHWIGRSHEDIAMTNSFQGSTLTAPFHTVKGSGR